MYCLDLAWKLAHWNELTRGLEWWMIALALAVRFAVMAGFLYFYLRLRRSSKNLV